MFLNVDSQLLWDMRATEELLFAAEEGSLAERRLHIPRQFALVKGQRRKVLSLERAGQGPLTRYTGGENQEGRSCAGGGLETGLGWAAEHLG